MIFPVTLVDLAGAIALLLWGTHMVQTGIQRAYGPKLKSILGGALRNRFWAFLAGLGVTALLQSSTATGLMTAGFAAGGLMNVAPALAVMLGANVGTTLSRADSLLRCRRRVARSHRRWRAHVPQLSAQTRDLGRVFIGLGLMLLALHQLLDMMSVYEDAPNLRILLGAISTTPFLDVFLAAGMTWAAHSSVATVLLIMSLAAKGVVPPDAAFALVLGANLGSAINPVIEGPAGDDPAARRLPFGNLLTRVTGAALALAALHPIGRFMVAIEPDNARAVADFHTLFNLAVALAFFPLLKPYAVLLRRWFPRRSAKADPSRPVYLDAAAKETPIVALGAAAREALRLSDVLGEMLLAARELLAKGDRKLIAETRRHDNILDRLNTAIKAYLTSLDPDELNETDHRRLNEIMTFTMNIEQAGDVVHRNLLTHATKQMRRGLVFSGQEKTELITLMDRLSANLRTAASLFMTEDPRTARLLASEKVAFREADSKATASHFERLRAGQLEDAQASTLYLNLLRDTKLINGHIVAAAAYPILERLGELLPSRHATNGS